MQALTRRGLVLTGAAVWFGTACRAAAPLQPTPELTEGPFYPDVLPSDLDADLTRIAGKSGAAAGEVLAMTGRVLRMDGTPVRGAVVEIWQVDDHGHYLHRGDYAAGERDPNFQGFGRTQVDAQGQYRFRTIRPVAYDFRAPHIHVKARPPGGRVLTTQMHIAGEPKNDRDGILRRVRPDQQRLVVAELRPGAGDVRWTAQFDLVLA
jgi:protocatechuate 3,4-dioxygenase beta subunit